MNPFVILYRNYLEDVRVERFETLADAQAFMREPDRDPAVSGLLVAGEADARAIGTEMLRRLYNMWAEEGDREVTRFENRTIACNRFLVRLETRFQHLPIKQVAKPVDEDPAQQENEMTKKKKKVAKKANGQRKPRENSVSATILKMISRDRGATKKEILETVVEQNKDRDPKALDNTVRGTLSTMSRNLPKFKKEKDEKRGLVYSVG